MNLLEKFTTCSKKNPWIYSLPLLFFSMNSAVAGDMLSNLFENDDESSTTTTSTTKRRAKDEKWTNQDDKYKTPLRRLAVYGDYLYWQATEDSLRYAQKDGNGDACNSCGQATCLFPTTKNVEQDFDFTSGFRVGVVIPTHYDFWLVDINYLRYNAHPDDVRVSDCSSTQDITATLDLPIFGLPNANSEVSSVKGKWHLNLNTVDVDLRRPIYFNRFCFTPFGGVKAVWIKQRVHVFYRGVLNEVPGDAFPQNVEAENDFWGVGPMIGFDFRFLLWRGFEIFFNGSFTPTFGRFNLETEYENFIVNGAPTPGELRVKDDKFRVSLVETFSAGINKKIIMTDSSSFEIGVAWEVEIFSRQGRFNWFSTFTDAPNGSDLTLQGLVVRGRLNF